MLNALQITLLEAQVWQRGHGLSSRQRVQYAEGNLIFANVRSIGVGVLIELDRLPLGGGGRWVHVVVRRWMAVDGRALQHGADFCGYVRVHGRLNVRGVEMDVQGKAMV